MKPDAANLRIIAASNSVAAMRAALLNAAAYIASLKPRSIDIEHVALLGEYHASFKDDDGEGLVGTGYTEIQAVSDLLYGEWDAEQVRVEKVDV